MFPQTLTSPASAIAPPALLRAAPELKDAFPYTQPNRMLYALNSPLLGNPVHWKLIPEIEADHKMQWCETIKIPIDMKLSATAADVKLSSKVANRKNALLALLKQSEVANIVLCKRLGSDEHNIGAGTVSGPKGFKKGEVVTFYAAESVTNHTKERVRSNYRMHVTCEHSSESNTSYSSAVHDAEYHGNVARWMPHLPSKDELADYDSLPEEIIPFIMTENMRIIELEIGGIDVVTFIARDDVPPYVPIGFSYSEDFFADKNLPFYLLNRNGEAYVQVLIQNDKNTGKKIYHCTLLPPALFDLATIKFFQGDFNSAVHYFATAILQYQKNSLNNHKVISGYVYIFLCCSLMGLEPIAQLFMQEAVRLTTLTFGPNHLLTQLLRMSLTPPPVPQAPADSLPPEVATSGFNMTGLS